MFSFMTPLLVHLPYVQIFGNSNKHLELYITFPTPLGLYIGGFINNVVTGSKLESGNIAANISKNALRLIIL